MSKGTLFVISSPSGGGKSTIISRLLKNDKNLKYSVSATTRKPRKGEVNGIDYYFLSENEFKEKIKKGEFLEWAEVHNNYYGTLRSQIENTLNRGHNVILDIDVQGGSSVKKIMPEAVLIFLMPPSLEELEKRLRNRGTDSEEDIKKRLENARHEIDQSSKYDFKVVNNEISETVTMVEKIIKQFNEV